MTKVSNSNSRRRRPASTKGTTRPGGRRAKTRLIAVSNRLPITLERVNGALRAKPGGGGLVRAIAPVLRHRGGIWIGWSGTTEEADIDQVLNRASQETGYQLAVVSLTEEEVENFYKGFSNQVIWPLFHDLQTRCTFAPEYWNSYKVVNAKFAEVVARNSTTSDYIWIHDYHLMHLARMMRQRGLTRKTGFFLHIPFPSQDIFMKLPWRTHILQALVEFDLIGFQTLRDRRNFTSCLQFFWPEIKVQGRGIVQTLLIGERRVRVGSFPISIDAEAFQSRAGSQEVSELVAWIRKSMMGSMMMLGADRLDYTKGLPERLLSFREALRRHPGLHNQLTYVQVVVPSREDITEYRTLKAEVERLVGEINGEFSNAGWVPIHYYYRNLDLDNLLAHYRAARIALITPLKDGMNLVAKEFCASKVNLDGVLILSEFAGAASQMHRDALIVNPYDIEGVADAIWDAFKMDKETMRLRMRKLRDGVRRNDIFRWLDSYLQAAFAVDLEQFPPAEEYIPEAHLEIEGE